MKNGNPPFFKVDTSLASEGGCQSPAPSTPVSAYVPFTSAKKSSPMSPSKEPSSRLPTVATISLAPTTTTTVVTTTTTTTTTFPPLLLKPPPLPKQLDPKEYPLADTPTPPALKRFCFDLNGQPAYIREDEDSEQQIIKLQEALYNMRASSTPSTRTVKTSVTSTQQSYNDNYVDTIPSGSGARKRPASPIEPAIDFSVNAQHQNSIGTYNKLSRERRSLSPPHKKVRAKSVNSMLEQENELASQRQWMEFTTDFRDNSVNSGITIPRTNTPLSTVQGESSTSIITQQVPTTSRPFNTISTSNLGMDTPSTTRSTHSSALPSPSLSPIAGVSTSRNTNQFETYFAEHSVRDDVDGDDVTVDEPLSTGINENWSLQQITTTDTSNTPSLWDLNTMLTTFDALPASMKSYMLFQLLRRCPTNTLQYVSNIILPALRKDFVGTLPIELSLHIVRYLDAGSMCRAAQVSKRWRNVIDGDGLTWQRRLKLDGFGVDPNEESRAIAENWGLIRPIKSTHNRNRQLDSTNNESGTSSSEERTVVEIDDDDTDNMRVVNEDKESSSDSSGLDMYRTSLNDNMAVDIDISDQKNNSIVDNNELQDSITLSPTGTDEPSSSVGTSSLFEEKPPLPPSATHPYKAIYRRHYLMRQNWINGRHKHISFQGHGNNVVTCLQFDSEKIISGSDDQCINVYETSTGKLINRLEGHDGGVWALQYVDKTLVSGSTDRTVRVWDLEKGICTHVFPGHTSTVR
ncbi:28164_t:CDS:2, partial [Dentiscutata erythropus]